MQWMARIIQELSESTKDWVYTTIQVLIDGGSTHNFIQDHLAKCLGLPRTNYTPFSVLIGNAEENWVLK